MTMNKKDSFRTGEKNVGRINQKADKLLDKIKVKLKSILEDIEKYESLSQGGYANAEFAAVENARNKGYL